MLFSPHRACAVLAAAALAGPLPAHAALSFDEAGRLAREQAPSLAAQQNALAGARAVQPAATALPDPRLSVGIDNLPISGADRFSLTRDFMTMQRIGVMQEVPNRAKREARAAGALARIERERAMLVVAQLAVQREAALAWLGVFFAERRAAQLTELERENRVVQDTLDARVASGKAMPAERTMARQEALALADRRDDAVRDVAKARAALRRWVGARADEALAGEPPTVAVESEAVRAGLHRHAEIAPYAAMQAIVQAEVGEADAEQRGDWAWEVAYQRRGPQYGDMLSFQLSFDLPWQKGRRQQPQIAAKQAEVQRVEAERDETLRKHGEEIEGQLAELQALDAQRARLEGSGLALAAERVALALASYQAGRGDLAAVLTARREAVETRLRLIDLDAQRAALRVRLTTLIAEQ
ncbi:MAG: TolC family protein [Burkholderiaceae bacterium]|nr:TolC family protein [Burkholderiaceae bacterium]